jgi:hypothetical protein
LPQQELATDQWYWHPPLRCHILHDVLSWRGSLRPV